MLMTPLHQRLARQEILVIPLLDSQFYVRREHSLHHSDHLRCSVSEHSHLGDIVFEVVSDPDHHHASHATIRTYPTLSKTDPKATFLLVLRAAAVLLSPHCGMSHIDLPLPIYNLYKTHHSEAVVRQVPLRPRHSPDAVHGAYVSFVLPSLDQDFVAARGCSFDFSFGEAQYELVSHGHAASLHQSRPAIRPLIGLELRFPNKGATAEHVDVDAIRLVDYRHDRADLDACTWLSPVLHLVDVLMEHFHKTQVDIPSELTVKLLPTSAQAQGLHLDPVEDTLLFGSELAKHHEVKTIRHELHTTQDEDGFNFDVVRFVRKTGIGARKEGSPVRKPVEPGRGFMRAKVGDENPFFSSSEDE